MHKSNTLPLLFFLCWISIVSAIASSPGEWMEWQRLYKDSRIEVQVRFQEARWTSCTNREGNDIKYEYRVRGRFRSEAQFVNWRLTYLDCEFNLIERINCFQIGGMDDEDNMKWLVVQSEYFQFTGSQVRVTPGSEAGSFCMEEVNMLIQGPIVESLMEEGLDENKDIYALSSSQTPNGIAGKTMVRVGEWTELEVEGGKLGYQAEWIWYLNECGGEIIGQGRSISFRPDGNCEIYVRAEGPMGKSRCALVSLFIDRKNVPATSIKSIPLVCPGTSIDLTAEGGYLGEGAQWV